MHRFFCWGGRSGWGSIGGDMLVDIEELGREVEGGIKNGNDFNYFQKNLWDGLI